MSDKLYEHKPHPHIPRNVNLLRMTEQATASFNERFAVSLTHLFSSMWTFWCIVTWIGLWILWSYLLPSFADKMPWPLLLALASVPQLPLMIVIMVGQAVIGRHQELQADEQYHTTVKTAHEIDQIVQHMDAQDKILQHILFLIAQERLPSKGVAMSRAETAIDAPENTTNEKDKTT